ncbi:diguanylate cyclase [Azospirillum sp.]|uniref:GGDEF domain-containing response regulator n=1 Tax=Azospirillum sp. TaxID=34012 RepID=UPI002D423108|nr:diguanylate cyclase [Azospirillum sp.]HYD65018.1 diguanylate cyclase [Azospirillum sp.]
MSDDNQICQIAVCSEPCERAILRMDTQADRGGPGHVRPKILVVDDTLANLVVLKRLLARVDAEVIAAASGNEALALTLDHDFALFLLDVQMPEMDGYELAELLSGEERTKAVPIIFLTAAYKDERHRLRAYGTGAVDYIEKPINDQVLLAKVGVFLELFNNKDALQWVLAELAQKNVDLNVEIARRQQLEEDLRRLATIDVLTNVPNRRHFMETAEAESRRFHRYGHPLSLILFDIDHFKQVNDTHGHAAGDQVLSRLSDTCVMALRDQDVLGRLGGEEFAVLLPETDSAAGVAVAERLRETVERASPEWSMGELAVTISVGVTTWEPDDATVETVLQRADGALYEAKRSGRNRVAIA